MERCSDVSLLTSWYRTTFRIYVWCVLWTIPLIVYVLPIRVFCRGLSRANTASALWPITLDNHIDLT